MRKHHSSRRRRGHGRRVRNYHVSRGGIRL
jgi:hypothetical protein